jgi:two-component system, NtrC family, sensor kinase
MLPSALSLLKMRREILWLGDGKDTPQQVLAPILQRIHFVPVSRARRYLGTRDYPVVVGSVSVESDALDFWRQLPEDTLRFLVVDSVAPASPGISKALLDVGHFQKVFKLPEDGAELTRDIQQAVDKQTRDEALQTERRKLRSRSKELESRSKDLEALAHERTLHLQVTKREIEAKGLRIRRLIHFLKELSVTQSVEDLLLLLREDARHFHQVKDPILIFHNSSGNILALYLQGQRVMHKLRLDPWPEIHRSRSNDKTDSQYLANILSRPFARVLAIPLQIQRLRDRQETTSPAVIYFEHDLDERNKVSFFEFIEDRLPALSVAMDRVFLEGDLTEAAQLWERTFDGISDPVAIVTREGVTLRSNRAFTVHLEGLEAPALFQSPVRFQDRVYELRSYPIAEGEGETPTNLVLHYLDITQADHLQKRMIQQEKMVALGHLAGHVAHELNNPLTGIRAMAQVLISQLSEGHQVRGDLEEVEKAAERCQTIIKNLSDFSKGGVGSRLVLVSLNDLIKKTLPLLKTLMAPFEQNIVFTSENIDIHVEPQLLQQVIFNLIKNACQAMEGPGRLHIQTSVDVQDGKPMAIFCIQDTGVGIPTEFQNQVFDYFFTTKVSGQGTGLGLSMSKSIVESFGGHIELQSTPGQGAEFKVCLPRFRSVDGTGS